MHLNLSQHDAAWYRRNPQSFLHECKETWEMRNPIFIQMLNLSELDEGQQVSFFHTLESIELPDYLPEAVLKSIFSDPKDPIDEYGFLDNRELLALGLCQTSLEGPKERRDQVRWKVGLVLRTRRLLS
ncbi:hypothetical protein KJ611_03370 [Patescibacteria group bacterium]|nr:hypothetical protein [Patescibacteria group bacterium]MBU1705470.1 hypothetical protein [Patescibacteria group bacterium]